ncbi:tyrosine-type recombinase/integrase [Haloferax marisrubri]|uniref:Integrase n=1 Tax=Haloferax marisrubri TaxID=1544719 RepID=A0A2P4NKZ4_9EURY|nr:site-specific integrase [Haloferax marisrubri]POG53808.1 hypothetical protein AUR65_018720 [Haloferax marisrubri]
MTSDSPTSDDVVNEYLEHHVGLILTEQTGRKYEGVLREYCRFLESHDTSVLDADYRDVNRFIEGCVRRGNRISTLENKLSIVNGLYKYIHLWSDFGDKLELNPLRLQLIDTKQYNTPPEIKRVALSRRELRLLFREIKDYRNRLLVITGVETGLRNSDLRTILIDDVDLNQREIRVPHPKFSKPYTVPMSDELADELKLWITEGRSGYAISEYSPYLFPGRRSEKLESNNAVNQIIDRAAKSAGIQGVIGTTALTEAQRRVLNTDKTERQWKRVTAHTLRHTFLTLLDDAGVPLPYRQLVANHSSPQTTQHYTHSEENAFKEIRRRFTPPR